jgi:chemotaxis protein methyltransferase CheR
MKSNEYQIIQNFLSQSCGITLGERKQYLVINRLSSLLIKFNLTSFSELTSIIQTNSSVAIRVKAAIVDAMTTNETYWFRDEMQFLELKEKIFPELFNKKNAGIKVWSAACSSGQEPYTISMCSEDAARPQGKNQTVQIIGTDISETILLKAKSAIYSELALARGLDDQIRNRFFQPVQSGYKLNENISRKVRFQQFNLLKPFTVLGRFDIIFCRNVLIYFSDEIKQDILTRMVNTLEPGGYIFLSSTEAMPASISELEPVRIGKARYFKKVC